MKSRLLAAAGASILLASAATARAGVLYSNPYDDSGSGDCSWSTACAAFADQGNDFAAQEFTLASANTLTSATFTELDYTNYGGSAPTSIDWAFYDADGSGGLPGTLVASGSSSASTTDLGPDPGSTGIGGGNYELTQGSFTLPSVVLNAGTYYMAIQGISGDITDYLAQGVASSGAAETMDGGVTWVAGYEGQPSVAVSISDSSVSAAPEPSTWLLMFAGIGGIGLMLRQAKRKMGFRFKDALAA